MKKAITLPIFFLSIATNATAQNVSYESEAVRLADRIMTINGMLDHHIFPHTTLTTDYELAHYLNTAKQQAYDAAQSNADIRDINTYLLRSPTANLSTRMLTTKRATTTYFYKHSPHLFTTQTAKSYWSIDPRLQGYYHIGNKHQIYNAAVGMMLQARIADRIGLYASVDYHREQFPHFFADRVAAYQAIPNVRNYTTQDNAYSYLQVNAHASLDIIKNGLTATVGQSRHFIGDGIRSLIISDFAAPMPYLSLQTKIGKFHYTNLFLHPQNQTIDVGFDRSKPQKYVAIHYLSVNATSWLNVGLFETLTSVRSSTPEISYFNPMIFYRSLERSLGSPDKMAIGVTAKIIPFKSVQLYGQFFINEFTAKYFFGNQGYLHNKWGAQGGFKYYNALGLNNLDIQGEVNIVRPYSYQHRSESNYSSNNMPLAHPLGAGFREAIVAVGFRPFSKLRMNIQTSFYQQGIDTSFAQNMGSNVIKNIKNNSGLFGVGMIHGLPINVLNMQFTAAYEVFPSLFFEGGIYLRQENQPDYLIPEQQYAYTFLGMRYNMARRNFMQF